MVRQTYYKYECPNGTHLFTVMDDVETCIYCWVADNPPKNAEPLTGRMVGKTWKAFTKCLQWAQQGKTFIYVHPRFVAIDTKTWLKLNKKEIDHKMVFFEEYQPWSKEMQAELDKIKRPIIDNEKFRQEYTGDWDNTNKEEKS